MPSIRPFVIAACALLALLQSVEAQESNRPAGAQSDRRAVMQACRADLRSLCADTQPGGGRMAQCLRDHASGLSDGCRSAIADARARQGRYTDIPAGVKVEQDIAYGSEPEQRMDVYLPQKAEKAPVIVMVHGGGWARGSKSAGAVVQNKVAHWLPKGFIFVSVEVRLLPKADPLEQAADLAAALASVQQKAASWSADPSKIVLMGHSAGAHIAALVSADKSIGEKAGLKPWAGTVALDSAAYDVAVIMQQPRRPKLYDRAFGKDPDFWAKASPTQQVTGGTPPMLLVCSSLRRLSCRQAETFAAKAGGKAQVLPVALRHEQVNSELGKDSGYTRDVDDFLASIGIR